MKEVPPYTMTNEDKVPLGPMPEMGSVPQNPMPLYPQIPQNSMPQYPQVPQNPTAQLAPIPPLGPEPCMVTCPSCQSTVLTNVVTEPGMQTHLIALVLCLICVCCACVPYLVDSCQNVVHRCSNCNSYLGTYKR